MTLSQQHPPPAAALSRVDRAHGCLAGVALGDALGRASEFMTRDQIRARFGWLSDFAAPSPMHPGVGDPLGVVTDDSTQTLIIAHTLIEGRPLTPERVAAALVAWARDHDGLNNPYLGPSTRRALGRLMAGASPRETGGQGTTNGSAMRVAAIGIVDGPDFDAVLADVVASGIPTHDTRNGHQAAAAAAFAVAAAMRPGASLDDVVAAAQDGARRGRAFGQWSWATPLDTRIELAVRLVRKSASLEDALQALYDYVGVGLDPAESVASAIGVVVAVGGAPMAAIQAGINLGGDTDTIASLAGGICGAMRGPGEIDARQLALVESVNHLDLAGIARDLVGGKA